MALTPFQMVRGMFDEAQAERKEYEDMWKQVCDLIDPAMRASLEETSKHALMTSAVSDGAPINALDVYTDGVASQLCSESFPFFVLGLPEGLESTAFDDWKLAAERYVYGQLTRGGFYAAMREVIRSGGTIGTMTMAHYDQPVKRRTVYKMIPPMEMFCALDYDGDPNIWFRRHTVKAFEADRMGLASDEITRVMDKNPNGPVELIHAVFGPGAAPDLIQSGSEYAEFYFTASSKDFLFEGTRLSSPYTTGRQITVSGDVYGHSIGELAYYDIQGLQRITESIIVAAQLSTEPILNIPVEMQGDEEIKPHGRNYYQDTNRLIYATNIAGNPLLGVDVQNARTNIIRKHFKYDYFKALSSVEREMSAAEAVGRQGESSLLLTGVVSALTRTVLDKVIKATIDIGIRAARLRPIPQIDLMEIEYISPLALAQKLGHAQIGMSSLIQMAQVIGAFDPAATLAVKWDGVLRETATYARVAPHLLRTEAEVEAIRQQLQEAQLGTGTR